MPADGNWSKAGQLFRARGPAGLLSRVLRRLARPLIDAYTRPDARRQGLDAGVRSAVFEAVRAMGRKRVYSYARGDNPDGLRAAARHQHEAGTARYVVLFGSSRFVSVSRASLASALQDTSNSTSKGR